MIEYIHDNKQLRLFITASQKKIPSGEQQEQQQQQARGEREQQQQRGGKQGGHQQDQAGDGHAPRQGRIRSL